jgi:hypothetical protein
MVDNTGEQSMLLNPATVDSRYFTYDAKERLFVTEMSDLDNGGTREAFGRVYDDACDVGLTIISQRTGSAVVFCLSEEKRDGEGDMMYWELEVVPECCRGIQSHLKGMKIRIFND